MTQDKTALLPCPFCGSTDIEEDGWASTDTHGPACSKCQGSAGGASWSPEQNIAAWNTRPAAGAGEALAALEELANMPLGISLEDWCRLSGPILAALRSLPPDDGSMVEQAFRDGLAYGSNVKDADPDVAWQQSRIRAALAARSTP